MNKTLKLLLIYTVLFGVLTIGIFILFILAHKSFIQYGDGYKQGYFWIIEVRQQLQDIASGEGFHMWSWSKGFGMEASTGYIVDPFMILAALFPPGYIELGYTVTNILKMYCGGLVFFAFCRFVKLGDYQSVLGPLCYTFSAWFIEVALCQGSLLMNAYLFPLLVLSTEWVYKKKSPVFFIIVVAYYMMRTFYFAYMSAIVIIIYILLRYFAYHDQFNIKEYLANIGRFVIYGICGCLISFITMLPYVSEIFGASTESATDTFSVLFAIKYYIGFGERMIGQGMADDYLDVGLPIFILLLLPIAVRQISRKATGTIMTIILFVMMMIPFFCSMFNAFGYPTLRWSYMFLFFAVWAAMTVLDLSELRKKSNLVLMSVALIVLAVWTMGPVLTHTIHLDSNALIFVPWNLFAGLVMILCIGLGGREHQTVRQNLLLLFTLGALVIGWNGAFLHHTSDFLRNNQINSQLKQSTQRVGNQIEDNGFYRIDQVDGLNLHRDLKSPANENMWWQTKHIYLYDSKLPAGLLTFNKTVGNNYSYFKRVSILSNDNRMGLDYLTGVRYFLGDDTKNNRIGSDAYAGYGLAYYDTIDGVRIFKSKYDTSLGYAYDQCIRESEYNKLSRLQREQALLQAAVIPDNEKTNVKEVGSSEIETDIKDVPYTVTGTNGAEVEGNTITTSIENATVDLNVKNVSDAQLILSFDNLKRAGSADMYLTAENEKLSQVLINDDKNQTIPNRCDYDLNMGYYDEYSGTIRITVEYPGQYTFDRLYLSAMSADLYDKYAKIREDNLYQITEYDEETVRGTVDAGKDSIVYFSIPSYQNWDVYVDGIRQERIDNVNVAFMGVEVPAGQHEVVLQYSYKMMKYAGAVSIAGILMALIVCIISRRRRSGQSDR